MDASKIKALEAKGFKVGTAAEFLGLSPAEQSVVDMRLAMARLLREQRVTLGVQQAELAARVKTTQRRISLMESGDKSISIDKLVAANVALGMRLTDILQRVSVSISESYIDHQPKRALTIRRVTKHRQPAAK